MSTTPRNHEISNEIYRRFVDEFVTQRPGQRTYVSLASLKTLQEVQRWNVNFALLQGESLDDYCIVASLSEELPRGVVLPEYYNAVLPETDLGLRVFYCKPSPSSEI